MMYPPQHSAKERHTISRETTEADPSKERCHPTNHKPQKTRVNKSMSSYFVSRTRLTESGCVHLTTTVEFV